MMPTWTRSLCHRLHQAGREQKLDPVVCRDAEIDQMIDIPCRRRKNNPIVVGDAGVGKSAGGRPGPADCERRRTGPPENR